MSARFTLRTGFGTWKVWDLHEDQALASFSTLLDAESCRAACEMVRRDAQIECRQSGQDHGLETLPSVNTARRRRARVTGA